MVAPSERKKPWCNTYYITQKASSQSFLGCISDRSGVVQKIFKFFSVNHCSTAVLNNEFKVGIDVFRYDTMKFIFADIEVKGCFFNGEQKLLAKRYIVLHTINSRTVSLFGACRAEAASVCIVEMFDFFKGDIRHFFDDSELTDPVVFVDDGISCCSDGHHPDIVISAVGIIDNAHMVSLFDTPCFKG